jgi:hypothetical protein
VGISSCQPNGDDSRWFFLNHHRLHQAPRPHGACINVEVVKLMIGVLVNRALLRLQHMLIFSKYPRHTFAQLMREALLLN